MNPPQVYPCSPSWTLLSPPSPCPPSGSSHCTSPKHPVSCIEPGLATHFIHDILHVSMPFSQISPPSPSPTESIRLFYTSVSLLLSRTQGYCYHFFFFFTFLFWKFFAARILFQIRPKHSGPDYQKSLIFTWVRMNALIRISGSLYFGSKNI